MKNAVGPLAIVTGQGELPRLLAQACQASGRPFYLVLFNGFEPEWAQGLSQIKAEFERPGRLFDTLKAKHCTQVVFAGAMTRPKLSPLKFDLKMVRLIPHLMPALKAGDDVALRAISTIFETEGFELIAAHGLLQELLAPYGVLGTHKPSPSDLRDIDRAVLICRALGQVDVGQGAVVADGLCLGTESIQGTDQMLKFVTETRNKFVAAARSGVLYKSPKPKQDWRLDLPAIGPNTINNAARAGLNGVAVLGGGVLILGLEETISAADAAGIFLLGYDGESLDK